MYAVIKTGGKQYRLQENDIIRAEKLEGNPGQVIRLDQVLMVDDQVGKPLVAKAFVEAEIVAQVKGEKIRIFKKKRRQNYRRTTGHRQLLTVLRVVGISKDGTAPVRVAPVKKEKKVKAEASPKEAPAKKAPSKKPAAQKSKSKSKEE